MPNYYVLSSEYHKTYSAETRARFPEPPEPISCEYCGKPRYFIGRVTYDNGNKLLGFSWPEPIPELATACTCEEGLQQYRLLHTYSLRELEIVGRSEAFSKALDFMNESSSIKYLVKIKEIKPRLTSANKPTYLTVNSFYQNYEYLNRLPMSSNIRKGLYLTGNPGTGKTVALAALYNNLQEAGIPVIFIPALEAIQLLLDYLKRDSISSFEKSPLELFKTVEVLILDDIDKINPTPWALGQLYDILNTRYTNYLSTFFTSNHSLPELTKELSKKTPKDSHTAAAITDRIACMCYSLTLEGESWRQKQ